MIIIFFGLLLLQNYLVGMEQSTDTQLTQIDRALERGTLALTAKFPELSEKIKSPYGKQIVLECYLQHECKKSFRLSPDDGKKSLIYNIFGKQYGDKICTGIVRNNDPSLLPFIARQITKLKYAQTQGLPHDLLTIITDTLYKPYLILHSSSKADFQRQIMAAKVSPNKQFAAVALPHFGVADILELFSRHLKKIENRYTEDNLSCIQFCTDNRIVVGTYTGLITIYNLSWGPNFSCSHQINTNKDSIVSVNPLDENIFIITTQNASVIKYDIEELTKKSLYRDNSLEAPGICCADVSPNKESIGVGFGDGSIKIWNSTSHQLEYMFQAHTGPVLNITWRGTRLVSCGKDQIKIWNLGDISNPHTINHPGISSCAVSPNNNYLAAYGKEIKVYNLSDNKLIFWTEGKDVPQSSICFSDDNTIDYAKNSELHTINIALYNLYNSMHPTEKPLIQLLDYIASDKA